MEEIRVSFETAKLAKEKGFDIDCGWKLRKLENGSFTHTNSSELGIEQPTQSLLQKWLREVHNINVLVYRIGSILLVIMVMIKILFIILMKKH